jgi:hypothetical protein
MAKRTNRYQIKLAQLSSSKENAILNPEITIEIENHDEIFQIIELVKAKKLFEEDAKAVEFALGLKMFSEVLITNPDIAFFKSFMPAFGSFMKEMKAFNGN